MNLVVRPGEDFNAFVSGTWIENAGPEARVESDPRPLLDDRSELDVAVSGASGLVGSRLCASLAAAGHRVRRIVRRAPAGEREVFWDPPLGTIEAQKLEGLDAVVNLAGENIGVGRWTSAKKERIRSSRVQSTRLLAETLGRLRRPPAVLINASAIGYYGDRGDEPLDESSRPGSGFLAKVGRAWEAATGAAELAGLRVVCLRIGVVLSREGGALPRMLLPIRLGVGGRLGDGTQYLSWIALDDLIGAIHFILFHPELAGPVNAVAPAPVTNAEFTRALGRALGRPTALPLPAFAIRLLFGEKGTELLLSGAYVIPRRLEQAGFQFTLPEIGRALQHVLGRPA